MKEYHKKINSSNKLKTQKQNNKKRKQEVLLNVRDIYNELYDIYKSKYNKKKSLDAKNKKKLDYKKLRLSDYLYLSEEEQEKQKPTKDDYKKLIEQIIDEETNINDDLFNKYFKIQRPSYMLMLLNKTKDKTKVNELVSVINSGLKD